MFGLYQPAPVLMEKGAGYFIPPHPEPRSEPLSLLGSILGARRSLIGDWLSEHYRQCVDDFRILGRQIVLVNDPEYVKYVFVHRHDNYERKSPQMRRALERLLGDGLFISDGDTWATRRPLVADIVHKRRVPEFLPTMEAVVANFCDNWRDLRDDEEIELTAQMAGLTAEIIARTVFGNRLGADAAEKVVQGFSIYQRNIDSFNLGYFIGWDNGWPIRLNKRKRQAVQAVHEVVDGVIEAHLREGGEQSSMISLLIKRNERSQMALDIEALRHEAATIFMAGHETTATTLTWALYLLANAPWAMERLLNEIIDVCGQRDVTGADVAKLDWCRSIIMETLRLYPPVPLLPRQAHDNDAIGEVKVEAGSLVMIAPWLLQRSPDFWPDPNHFRPERFAQGARYNPFAYIPFSVGPRVCAGMNFGLDEAVLCLATLVRKFEVTPRPGYFVEPICQLTLRPRGGLPVTVAPRRRSGR